MIKWMNFGVIQIGERLCVSWRVCVKSWDFSTKSLFLAMELRSSAQCWKMTFLGLNCIFGAQDDLGWVRGLLEKCLEYSKLENPAILGRFWSSLRVQNVAVQILDEFYHLI